MRALVLSGKPDLPPRCRDWTQAMNFSEVALSEDLYNHVQMLLLARNMRGHGALMQFMLGRPALILVAKVEVLFLAALSVSGYHLSGHLLAPLPEEFFPIRRELRVDVETDEASRILVGVDLNL